MPEIATIGLDIAKNVFQLHGVDRNGRMVLRRALRRSRCRISSASFPWA
jgi:transposase